MLLMFIVLHKDEKNHVLLLLRQSVCANENETKTKNFFFNVMCTSMYVCCVYAHTYVFLNALLLTIFSVSKIDLIF